MRCFYLYTSNKMCIMYNNKQINAKNKKVVFVIND